MLYCLLFIYSLFDLNTIYNDDFTYSLKRETLESYISGKAFDRTELYTEEEAKLLREDITEICAEILSENPIQEKVAILTAGAPGTGKTLKMRQDREEHPYYAYICPDDVCLKKQKRTYLAEINSLNPLEAYNKWRPGSNAAAHLILAHLILQGYGFYFGTTSSSPFSYLLYELLKEQHYTIRILHISAPDDVRWGSIKERDKTFVQTTEKDVIEKGVLVPQRLNDTYLKYADEIDFYYREEVKEDAILAAIWRKPGNLEIKDPLSFDKVKAIQDAIALQLERPDLLWDNSITIPSESIKPSS